MAGAFLSEGFAGVMGDSKMGFPPGEDPIEPPGDGALTLISVEGSDSPNLGRV